MWLNEFVHAVEGSKRHTAEVLLWSFSTLGLCCAVAGEFAMYIGGKLASHPDLIIVYIAYHPQKRSSDISILLQLQHNLAFSFDSFWNMSDFTIPGKLILYGIKYGEQTANLRIICTESTKPCTLRSNNDLTHYVWSIFDYYCTNYAMCVLPSHASGNKIV